MSHAQAEHAIKSAAIAALGDVAIEYENAAFSRPAGEKWAKLSIIRAGRTAVTLGENGVDRLDAVLQVDMNYPVNTGTEQATDDYALFQPAFSAGAAYTSEGQVARVVTCTMSSGRRIEQWYRVSYSVQWWAHIPRQEI